MKGALFSINTEEENKLPFILKSIGSRIHQEHITRPDGYPDFHWLHCTNGEGKLILADTEHLIRPKTGFFLFPGIPHEYYALKKPWETHWITFGGSASKNTVELLNFKQDGVYANMDTTRLDILMSDIFHRAQLFSVYRGFECSQLVYKFIIELKYCIDTSLSGIKNTPSKLLPVMIYIESHYNEAPTLDDMASVIHVSPRHLCRLFKHFLNVSPFDYLTRYRIKKAKEALIAPSNHTIGEVARLTGYGSASYFCSVFKSNEGLTPQEFRQMHKSIK